MNCASTPSEPAVSGAGVETGNVSMTGTVHGPEGPAGSVSITLLRDVWVSDAEQLPIRSTTTDDSGHYHFDSLPAGVYRISGMNTDVDSGFTRTLTAAGNSEATWSTVDSLRPASTVCGTLVVYDGRSPAGFTVGLRGTVYRTVVGATGGFCFAELPPGEHVLVAQHSEVNGGIPQTLTLHLQPDTTVEVRFVIPRPEPTSVSILPGQTWLYRVHSWNDYSQVRHILAGVSYQTYASVGDTTIDGQLYHHVSCVKYGQADIDNCVSISKSHVYIGLRDDSVIVLTSHQSLCRSTTPEALLKGSARDSVATSVDRYDTTVFVDRRVPVLLDAAPNTSWFERTAGDPLGNLPMLRTYVGNEIVNVPGGTFNCARYEWNWWDTPQSGAGGGPAPIRAADFVADIGCVRRFFQTYSDEGMHAISESIGMIQEYYGSDTSRYRAELPRVSEVLADSIREVVSLHWEPARFAAWISVIDTSENNKHLLFGDSEWTTTMHEALKRYIGCVGDSILHSPEGYYRDLSLEEEISFIAGLPGLDSLADFSHATDYLVLMLLSNQYGYVFAQGWNDCDWDWMQQGPINVTDTAAPYGQSARAKLLNERLQTDYLFVTALSRGALY